MRETWVSKDKNPALLCPQRVLEMQPGLLHYLKKHLVGMRRIVMEENELLGVYVFGHARRFKPGAVPPSLPVFVFFRGVLSVVNQNVCVLGEVSEYRIELAVAVLQVAGVDEGGASGFDPIAARALRVVHGKRMYGQMPKFDRVAIDLLKSSVGRQ